MTSGRTDWSLWLVLVVSVLIVGIASYLLHMALEPVNAAMLSNGLTNVATIGGIVSGLSLSGTAVLTLSGRYQSQVIGRFGTVVRYILFGGFSLLVAASLLCALSVVWVDQGWVKWVLAITAPVMLLTLISTALLINSAFSWKEQEPSSRADPMTGARKSQ
jgi:hypothetical protein